MASRLKNTKMKLDLLADADILLTVEKGIIRIIRIMSCLSPICKVNSKYMKDHDKKE